MTQQMEYLIDFNLELLRGCKWNCTGCNIAKEEQDGFLEGDFDRLMRLFADLQQNHHILSNIAITPTDFMVAQNSKKILTMELRPMFEMFGAVTLNSTFLEERELIAEWADILRPLLKGLTLKFSVPVEPEHYEKQKYMDIILGNIDYMLSMLPETKYTKTYLVGNLYEYKKFSDFEFYSKDFHNRWNGGHLDLVITEGRLPLHDINSRARLRNIIRFQNDLYDRTVEKRNFKDINFTYGKLHEGGDKDYVYKNGRIYAPVFVGEPLIVFEDSYSLGREIEWTTDNLVHFENQMTVESLEYLEETNECNTCEYANLCVARGLTKLMKTLHVKDCFAPKDAFNRVRQVEV